ncbi:MAG TPA: hypothetical protein VLN73_07635 [Alphaproteobacteria bacterium]|nr:hypothetical protein [Alphaproteobacteria bacterium]
MPYQEPDPTDPMTLHGVVVETDSEDAMVDMAVCFIEEYARLGFDEDRIWRMFHVQGYAGPAMALGVLGEDKIRELIAAEMELRGPQRPKEQSASMGPAGLSFPVLETGR